MNAHMEMLFIDQRQIWQESQRLWDDFFQVRTGDRMAVVPRKVFGRVEENAALRLQLSTDIRIRMAVDTAHLDKVVLQRQTNAPNEDD